MNLLKIRIPASVEQIGEDVFFDSANVYGEAGSAAETCCENHGNCVFMAEFGLTQ